VTKPYTFTMTFETETEVQALRALQTWADNRLQTIRLDREKAQRDRDQARGF
jgi:hypothetical protein